MEKDYNKLYEDHLVCKNCNRDTPGGIEEYKNAKTGRITKTCSKCRACVLKSLAKNPHLTPLPLKTKLHILKRVINSLDPDIIEQLHAEEPLLQKIIIH